MEFTDPIERLMNEHQHGLRELEKMRQAGHELKTSGFKPETYQALQAATDFINGDLRTHNENEENALFPLLEARMGQGGPTTVMRAEHQQLWSALDQLEWGLKGLSENPSNGAKVDEIAGLTNFIYTLLSQHISKEDNILYPMAREMLTQEDFRLVSERMNGLLNPVPPSV